MQFSKFLKVTAVTLPLIAVTACSSNSSKKVLGNVSVPNDIQAQIQKLEQINTVYFDYDRYNVKSEYSTLLNAHAVFIRATSSKLKVVIEGHADERGTPEYNIALGERRAAAVKSYLQANGASGEQLSIVSYGKEKPAVLGHNEAAYAKNRRAVITYDLF